MTSHNPKISIIGSPPKAFLECDCGKFNLKATNANSTELKQHVLHEHEEHVAAAQQEELQANCTHEEEIIVQRYDPADNLPPAVITCLRCKKRL